MSSVSSLRERCGTPMQASMLEFVLATADMTTEVIADGRHLSPELLRFVVTVKGADRTALVTDCSRALDQPPGMSTFGPLDGGEAFYSDGSVGLLPDSVNLASSVRGMDFMVRHMHRQVGLDLPTAVRMATLTPATIIGLQDEIGSLAPESVRTCCFSTPGSTSRGYSWTAGPSRSRHNLATGSGPGERPGPSPSRTDPGIY